MTFAIITHVPHIIERNTYFAYAPYVSEMNVWAKYVEELIVVAPIIKTGKTLVDKPYQHHNIQFSPIEGFDVLNLKGVFSTVLKMPKIIWTIFKAMKSADHIHLRCPGNTGLVACLVQIAFPQKIKTAKYAGNWDPKSKQPWTYKLQQWILNNTFLTRNMQVLVYGDWDGSSKNIKPFFTATYQEIDKLPITKKEVKGRVNFIFVGTLVKGKNPLYAIQLVEDLLKKGYDVCLSLYGEGIERATIEQYIIAHQLEALIELQGNQSKETVQKAYQKSHFVILPSDSEGWPKAIAEGMFWGCIPLAMAVSCVPFMLDQGSRGILLAMDLEKDTTQIETLLHTQMDFDTKSRNASDWSRNYTLDVFEREIRDLLKHDSKFKK
ncbi:glycosyltransferase [Flavobacterium xinjiangense]|uniref:Glycosyltransferase involved in cell wall bisynthesis n=1 Tax=Flavobacterium xinjiangense TaxID=178356 RepID=A0A1M7MXH3_9FLAO|nr:glycosyltransferase [Flavobacterium xinjiangense]SHM95878.1 Glycosyltransferase involved in cell wall bisynthesis [Flavobacterium xinjiangense]